jgi:hypothetical protein
LDVFYPGKDSQLKHRWWEGSRWSNEEDLGGFVSAGVGASSWGQGRLDCFTQSGDSGVWHKWFE